VYFTGLDYKNPDRVKYAYKIPEIKDEWISLGTQNSIPLIGLTPGTYHLQVKTSTRDGSWSDPKELTLNFLPKWYQTWWLRLLACITTAAFIYLFYRYRISQIKKQHEIRKNIAADLHDNLGSSLNSVKIFANLALNGIQPEGNLKQVIKSMEQATMDLRDMLWVLDDSLDTIDELVTRLNQYTGPVSSAINIDTRIKTDFDTGKRLLTKKEKSNMLLICKEAINNSIKYSGATQITVVIASNGPKIHITIADNGKGFNINEVKKGYGLHNMQYRAKQIKYNIVITTAEEKGTQIEITQP
jgi:signal transduction histidine kinase